MSDNEISGEASEECRVALQVALKVIGERCAMGLETPDFETGLSVLPPEEILEIAHRHSKMSREEKIDAIKKEWAINLAKEWIKSTWPYLKEGTDEYERAVDSMATSAAEGIVD